MSEKGDVSQDTEESKPAVPPNDLTLNLDLYNYDSPDAQSCPYVLTSPRSLEACSRVGVKPVDLLHKTLSEFSDEVQTDKPLEEIIKLYDEHERQRIVLLQKCQAEREFLIWRSTSKRRSHSLSPSRHNRGKGVHKSKDCSTLSQAHRNCKRRKSHDDILAANRQEKTDTHGCCVKTLGGQPTSFSTPTSPYYQGSRNLFVRITSPVVCAKLHTFPKAKMRLPPKDMKILEVILQKYEKMEEEEERKARAQRRWDQEKEELSRQKEATEMERWKFLALKKKRSNSEEHLKNIGSEKDTPSHCSKYSVPENEATEKCALQKRHSFKCIVEDCFSDFSRFKGWRNLTSLFILKIFVYLSAGFNFCIQLLETKQSLLMSSRILVLANLCLSGFLVMKQSKSFVKSNLNRNREEFKEKLKQVKMNQQELDKAMDKWRSQVVSYQEEANLRAAEKVAETVQEKRLRAMHGRLQKQEEHKRNMQKIEAEDYAKLQEMMAKLRSKDERCRAFKEEKTSTIEQSRQVAQAASDLRDLIRQRLDKDSFLRKSQQAALESRLLSIEPRTSRSPNPLEKE